MIVGEATDCVCPVSRKFSRASPAERPEEAQER